jgi:hypothetical protein
LNKLHPLIFDLKPLIFDLKPFFQSINEISKAFADFNKIVEIHDLKAYVEKLRFENERKERDRRWKDDPLQLKALCIDPVVGHFRVQTVEVLEWMLKKVKNEY